METDISSLGTHFTWLLTLEGDLGFKTGYSWLFFTVDIRVSILRIHIKLKEILWFPGHISFFFLLPCSSFYQKVNWYTARSYAAYVKYRRKLFYL